MFSYITGSPDPLVMLVAKFGPNAMRVKPADETGCLSSPSALPIRRYPQFLRDCDWGIATLPATRRQRQEVGGGARLCGLSLGVAAGHFAGHHGLLGAGAGCLVGRHEADKQAREQAQPDQGSNTSHRAR